MNNEQNVNFLYGVSSVLYLSEFRDNTGETCNSGLNGHALLCPAGYGWLAAMHSCGVLLTKHGHVNNLALFVARVCF